MNQEDFEKGLEQALALYEEGKPLQVIFGLFPRHKEALEEMFGMIEWIEGERNQIVPRPALLRETLDKLAFIDEARAVETGAENLSSSPLQKIFPKRNRDGDVDVSENPAFIFLAEKLAVLKKVFSQKPKVAWGSTGGLAVALVLFFFLRGGTVTDTNIVATNTMVARNDIQAASEEATSAPEVTTIAMKTTAPIAASGVTSAVDTSSVDVLLKSAQAEREILNGAEKDSDFLDPSQDMITGLNGTFSGTLDANACTNITATQTTFDKKISTTKTAFSKSFDERKTLLENQRTARYEALKTERANRDKGYADTLATLKDRATSAADKTSIQTFTDLVAKLQSARGKKIDAAMATYRSGIDASMKRRQTTIADGLLAFDNQIKKAFQSATKTCKTDTSGAKANLQKAIITARDLLVKNIGTKDAMKPVLDSLESTRGRGVDAANTEYETGLRNALHTLPLF